MEDRIVEKIKLKTALRYAHGGHTVVEYPAGEYEVGEGRGQLPPRVAEVAKNDHGAEEVKPRQKQGGKKPAGASGEGEGQ